MTSPLLSPRRRGDEIPQEGKPPSWEESNFDFSGQAAVVLGNSPALNHVDLSSLRRVATVGVNRICRAFQPDALLVCDPAIVQEEEAYIRAFRGMVLAWSGLERGWLHDLPEVRTYALAAGNGDDRRWPERAGDPLIREGTTTTYALQIAVLAGARRLGILGVDFSASRLAGQRADTHFYGDGRALGSTGGAGWHIAREQFHRAFREWAEGRGCDCYNLSPFPDTPIHAAGWPKMSAAEFVERFGRAEGYSWRSGTS